MSPSISEQLPAIRHEKGPSSGRYVIDLDDGLVAEMTYQRIGDKNILIDHTRVPEQYRGRNIAGKLMLHVVDEARRNGTKITPVCSYAVSQFKRHKEWADLLSE
ncbi:hypothetical protein MNBD_ALPHA12-2052 [hydrothermal vent metagenome]|uniref:N-acetyltransferase domain-containing protein n=1 Tax=hydrothermal vent metagenome TaxID=652676 RepID=A0A3B0U6N2_9ZZZZ